MIFIGYANDDRYTIVESIVFHLKNWGFHIWYDFHDMYLGDDRQKTNFDYGIGKSKYVIFIISRNTFKSKCALEELIFARKKYEQNEIVFFPILYEFTANELPREFFWLRKIIYNETSVSSGTFYVVNQIIEKVLQDLKKTLKYKSLSALSQCLRTYNLYLSLLLETIESVDLDNYCARMGILYSVYLYISTELNTLDDFPLHCRKTIERIFALTRLNISIDHLTYGIFQDTILIATNYYFIKVYPN